MPILPPLIIRPIGNTESAAAIELILPIQQNEFGVPVTLADQPDLIDIDAFYHAPGGCFWGGYVAGQLVGTIALINAGGGLGALRKMFVKSSFRGSDKGVAAALLSTLITFCRETEISSVYLGTVRSMQAAHRFYEKNGFIEIDKAALPHHFPLIAADNVFYHLNPQP